MLSERERLMLEVLRRYAGEWAEADAVARRLRGDGHEWATAQGVGQVLSRLSREGHCEKSYGDWGRYRLPMRAVTIYDERGDEAGRLLMVKVKDGLELDLDQLAGLMKREGHRIVLDKRRTRTLRAACDETLFGGP